MGEINVACSRLRVPQNVLLPLTRRDECKLASLLKRPYLTRQPEWRREVRENNNQLCHLFTFVKSLIKIKTCNVNMLLWQMELIQQTKVKAEIQSLSAIAPDFLTNIYLPNKLRYKGWV